MIMVEIETSPNTQRGRHMRDLLARLAARPAWLEAALEPERVEAALAQHIPAVASGQLRLDRTAPLRLMSKDTSGRWRGVYELVGQTPDASGRQTWPLRVVLTAPGFDRPSGAGQPEPQPFEDEGWRRHLPDLRMEVTHEPPEQALEILPQLVDPEQSRVLLERSIRAGSPARQDLRIAACQPTILNYKPGSRCTLGYRFEYAAEDADRGWPDAAIAKVYREHKGEQAYRGMAALWNTPLAAGAIVQIAEPLAYVPEWKLLVQAPLPEEQTLEQLLRATLRAPTPEAMARLEGIVRRVAAGLAALHRSGARAEERLDWEERNTTIPEALERIAVVAPELVADVAPLFERLLALDAAHPAEPPVPSHGSFDGDQILLAGDAIGFIDFDNFCMAEPALDVSHFRAAIMDSGMQVVDAATLHDPAAFRAYQDRLSRLCDVFLEEYRARAPIALERIAVWELWDYLRDALHLWTKPKLEGAEAVVRNLEFQLEQMGWME
jgi:hypothetical protein